MGLEQRIKRLEGAGRGSCTCGISIGVNGEFVRARIHGELVSEAEWLDYLAKHNPDGTCHLCGRRRPPKIKMGGPEHAARGRHGRRRAAL